MARSKAPPLPESGEFASPEAFQAWLAAGGSLDDGRGGRNKFGAIPVVVDGVRFDSTGEANRWDDLLKLQCAGAIAELRRQVAYDLHAPGGAVVGRIVLDFTYTEGGATVYEDWKGYRTPLYKWKKKHFEAEYGPILETGR